MEPDGTPAQKERRPVRLRTRLTLAFAIFALIVVTGLAVLAWQFWKSSPGQIVSVLVTAGVLVVLVAALAGYLLAGRLALPMELWAKAADRIGLGERDVSFPAGGGSYELSRVSAALQSMFIRLSEKEEALQARIQARTVELEAATEALRVERERLSNALEGSRLAYWDLDLESGEIRLSAEWSRMLGADSGESTTTVQDLLKIVPEEEHAEVSSKVFAVLKGEVPNYDIDHRVRRNDGTWLWVRSRGRVTLRADGRARRLVGTNVDITARKLLEEEQRANEERLRHVMDGVSSCICQVDLAGRILFANKRYSEFFGVGERSVTGLYIANVAGPAGAEAFQRCLPRLIRGEEVSYERELEVRGERFVLEVRLVPNRDGQGSTESVYATLTDITERRAEELRSRGHAA